MDDNFLDLHKNFLNWYYEPPLTGVKPGLTGTALSCPSKVTPSEVSRTGAQAQAFTPIQPSCLCCGRISGIFHFGHSHLLSCKTNDNIKILHIVLFITFYFSINNKLR